MCVPDEADFQPTCDSYLLDAQLLDLHFCRNGSICIDISDEEETDVAPEDAGIHGSRKVGLAIQKLQLALSEGRPPVGGWDVKALEALKLALFKQLKMDERRYGTCSFLGAMISTF